MVNVKVGDKFILKNPDGSIIEGEFINNDNINIPNFNIPPCKILVTIEDANISKEFTFNNDKAKLK